MQPSLINLKVSQAETADRIRRAEQVRFVRRLPPSRRTRRRVQGSASQLDVSVLAGTEP
jgi:hypothetical protein